MSENMSVRNLEMREYQEQAAQEPLPNDKYSTEKLQLILNNYGLKLFDADSYRKIWRLRTNEGYKYLKKSKLNEEELFFIAEVLIFLNQRGFKTAPPYLTGKNGLPFVNSDGDLYVLTDWYFGKELDYSSLNDLRQAIYFLADFHYHGKGFEPSIPNFRTFWYSWPAKLERRINELEDFRRMALAEKEESTFSRLYLRYFELFYRKAQISYERLLDSLYQNIAQDAFIQKSLCHHDYSGRNVIHTFNHQFILVDFDYCLRDIRIHDLINLIVRNLKHNDWNINLCRFILQEYHRVSPLTPEEIEVMYVLLSWPQDFWQVGLQYYYEKLPWPPRRFLKKLESKIDHRFQKEQFLRDFPTENSIFHWKEALNKDALSVSS